MAGYTPLFDTMLDGTLYGRWPHTGIWGCLLSQCDRRGNVDIVPALLAAKIGVTVDLLLQCISDFMQPDPDSRTGDLEGRRLELIDPASRQWGWRVINHAGYRERARKSAYDRERTDSGADAARKKAERDASRDVPRSPAASLDTPAQSAELAKTPDASPLQEEAKNPEKPLVPRSPDASRDVPLSEAEAKKSKRGLPKLRKCPPEFQPDTAFALSEIPDLDVEREIAKFKDWEFKTPRSDWPAAWRTWVRKARDDNRYSRRTSSTTTAPVRWT